MEIIDISKWKRREQFDLYSSYSDPFYSLTFSLDVTNLHRYVKCHSLSFYYSLCYLTALAMNSVEAFRYKIRGEDIVLLEELIPSFTDIKQGTDLFHIVMLPASGNIKDFSHSAREKSLKQEEFIVVDEKRERDEYIHMTCFPWFDITSYKQARDMDSDDSIPRVSWGKYVQREDRLVLHYSLEVNHRLLDGYHVGLFYKELEHRIAALE